MNKYRKPLPSTTAVATFILLCLAVVSVAGLTVCAYL